MELEFDNIDRAIIEYVTKHTGCTKNIVRTELNKEGRRISSPKTTNLRISKLIKSKVLRYDKKEGKGFYHLFVTDRTPYLTIEKQIQRIQSLVNKISVPLKELDRYSRGANFGREMITQKYINTFIMPYFNSIFTVLERLLDESTNNENISDKDSNVLHAKIIEVMRKVRKQSEVSDKEILNTNKNILAAFRDELLKSGPGFIKSLDPNTVNSLIDMIDDFEKQFYLSP